ncbi:MAG: class I SAM-dependent rRNA methyltransferase [Verrucomicrobiales bacterium]|nr:class I SAM-dependent rRNA methyltransferase [Verrucomicrobiales bacterium]
MSSPHRPQPPFGRRPDRPTSRGHGPRPVGIRPQPAPPESADWPRPWVQLRYFSQHSAIFPNMVGATSADAGAGDLVHVRDREGQAFGTGFFNPKARVPLRILRHQPEPLTEDGLDARLADALQLRSDLLRLPETTEAWRAIHSDGDGLPGLIVDRLGDTLSIEVTTLAVWRRLRRWLPLLHRTCGTAHHVIHLDPDIARMEGMRFADVPEADDPAPQKVRFTESGIRYGADFQTGHKTGFFCDQRDNRAQLGRWARGRVLDLCCYTGGFSLAARLQAGCEDVTGVDLDEKAIAQAKANANYNQTRIHWVHGDAFTWGRQMLQNREQWDTVVLDPPKLIHRRDDQDEGIFKYRDLNALAFQLVRPGGLLVTCSCSGLLSAEAFEELVIGSAHRRGHRLQILDRTGAGSDHPVFSHVPEGRYLKVLWCRVW